jgi:hypothetical protein
MLGATALARPDASGHACSGPLRLAPHDGYTILRIETTRPGFSKQTFVHVAHDPASGAPRPIGIWRQ